ncbi:hypothetical protein ABPG74_005120 [Tetrahymena malaccensis]
MNTDILLTDQQITNQDELITEQRELEMVNGLMQPQVESEQQNKDENHLYQNKTQNQLPKANQLAESIEIKSNSQIGFMDKLKNLLQKKPTTFIDENINEDEQNRRYQIAMRGWKKVKSVLTIIQYKRKVGILDSYQPKESKWAYSNFLLLPFSNFRFYFLLIESFFIIYNIFLVPFRYAFNLIRQENLMVIDIVMDSFFVCTIFIKFFCAYVDKTRVVKDFNSIAFRYCFGFLWMDSDGLFFFEVTALFPYYIFNTWYGTRFLRMLQIGCVLDYFQIFCNKVLGFFTSNINLTKSLTTILQFLLLLCIIAQYLSCFWYYLGIKKNVEYGYDKNAKEFRLMSGWVYEQLFVSDDNPAGEIGNNLQTEFVASLYWVFTTLTTLGYGDFYGQTSYERIFTMFVQFLGVFIFAYMMGNINNLIEKLNDDHLEYIQNENENLDQWIIKIDRANPTRKLPQSFVDDLRKRFTIYWQRDHTTVVQEFPFFNQLPVDLRSQLVDHIFKGFIDRFSVFFKGLEIQFVHAVVVNLYPKKYTQAEYDGLKQIDIIPIDTCPNDLFFITKGNVTIGSKDGVHKYITLGPGSYFGDHLILFNLKSSNAFIAIDEDVECMCIDRKILLDLCDFYPYSHKILKYKAYARRKHFREIKEKVMEQEEMQRPKYSANQIESNLNGGTQILTYSHQNSNKNSKVNQNSFNQAMVERLMNPDAESKAQSPVLRAHFVNSNYDKETNKDQQSGDQVIQSKKLFESQKEQNNSIQSQNRFKTESVQINEIQEIPHFIEFVEDSELKKVALQKELDQVNQIQSQFKQYIKDAVSNQGSKSPKDNHDESMQTIYNYEEENRKNEILKLAKDLNDKIEILKKSICLLDSDIKNKISNIKTELEFVTSYEEVLHDFDEDDKIVQTKN